MNFLQSPSLHPPTKICGLGEVAVMSFIKYYELLITKRSAVELKLSCVPIVQWDPAIKKPLFKHDSKPLLLYNRTFSVIQ